MLSTTNKLLTKNSFFQGFQRHATSIPSLSINNPQINTIDNQHLTKTAQEWFAKANEEFNQGNFPAAIPLYEKSIWSIPTASAYYNLGNALYSSHNYHFAIENWKKSILLDAKQLDCHLNIANVYAINLKETGKALEHYKNAIKLNSQDGEVRFNYAAVLEMEMRLDDALQEYETSLGLGVDRAKQNIRNIKVKILLKK